MATIAAAKKNTKGNKTAHVLNLLTAPGEISSPPAEGDSETPVQEAVQPTAGRPLLPPILEVAQANDDNLAQQIQQALEEELLQSEEAPAPETPVPAVEQHTSEEEPAPEPPPQAAPAGKMSQDDIEKMLASMAPQEPEPAPEPPPQAAPAGKMSQDDIEKMLASMAPQEPEPAPEPPPQAAPAGKMSQDDIEKMLASMAPPEPEPAPEPPPQAAPAGKMSQDDIEKMLASMAPPEPEPAPEPQPAPEPPQKAPPEEEVSYINIMQTLVEEKAPRYIKMFGLCPCKHCEADVMALTLSNLVPKYVVLAKRDVIPMLTVYEGRFNSTIFAQLTRACKTVMDHPHHNRTK